MQPKVHFIIHQPFSTPEVREAAISSTKTIDSGIIVNEYSKVQVRLISPDDSEAVLKIETYESDKIIELGVSDQEQIIMSGTNHEYMLVPGQYVFEIYSRGTRYTAYYTILSKDFSNDSLINLRIYLENLLNGLSYDLINERIGMAVPIPDMNPTLLQLLKFIQKSKSHIQRNLDMIIKDPISDLIGEYNLTQHSRKPDAKSFRWQAKNGRLNNTNTLAPQIYFEKHAQLSFRNIENQWVHFIIRFFLQSFRKLEISIQKEVIQIIKKMDYQYAQIENNNKQMELVSRNNAFGYQKTLYRLKRTNEGIKQKIEDLNNEKRKYLKNKQSLRQITYLFTEFEKTPWIQSLPSYKPKTTSQRLLRDYRYRRLYSLYKELSRLETKQVASELPGIEFRRTWQLFEYYNVGLIIDILRDNGYKWVSGWLADKESPHHHIGTLPPDTIMKFEKPNRDHYIEVVYDGELETNITDKSYSRFFNSVGRRPDIRITIHNLDGSLYSSKAGLIVESKCRRHIYLINQNIDPDVKSQLRDFRNLEYFDSEASIHGGDPVKSPIKQVIVLYPKQTGVEPVIADHVYGEGIVYLQIEPSDPHDEQKPFGYYDLNEKIISFLSQIHESEGV